MVFSAMDVVLVNVAGRVSVGVGTSEVFIELSNSGDLLGSRATVFDTFRELFKSLLEKTAVD